MSPLPKARVAVVVTRSLEEASFGRVKVLREILAALETEFDVSVFRLKNVLETRNFADVAGAAVEWSRGLLRGAALPLQTTLYSGTRAIDTLVDALCNGDFRAIYVDSVRSATLVRRLRARAPQLRLIVDFDDLMSRRMQNLADGGIQLSLGFIQNAVPKALRWVIEGPLSAGVVRYEAAALSRTEHDLVGAVQAVVLVSSAERDLLRKTLAHEQHAAVHAVPPPAASQVSGARVESPYRFVFIGSDVLAQNRLSIDVLLELWERLAPAASLHVYGRQQRRSRALPNVHFHGYVEQVADAYTSGSIMLLPVVLAGGIKTKVIEAWSFGCPVLGNALAFEGLEIDGYPLVKPESDWTRYLMAPADYAQTWDDAAKIGNEFVHKQLSRASFAAKWRDLMIPENV